MSDVDMAATIIAKSNQLNSSDLIGGPRTITVTRVTEGDTKEQPIAVFFEGDDGKPFMPCKSMRRVMVAVWGRDAKAYVGRTMTLYLDPTVLFGGIQVGGTRISHMSDMDGAMTMSLAESRKSKKPYKVQPLVVQPKVNTPPPPPPPKPAEPKHPLQDMNGPVLALVNSKGAEYKFGPDKWAATFEAWFTGAKQVPFDTAKAIYHDNQDNIAAAIVAGFAPQAKAVEDAWSARLQATQSDEIPA